MTMALPALSEISDLVDGRGGGIGGGQDGRHHAHRHADFDDFLFGNFAQDADGFHAAHAARKPVAVQQVLDVLVFGVAVAGLFHGQVGQPLGHWRAPPRPCAPRWRPPVPGNRCGTSARLRMPFRPWCGPPGWRGGLYPRASAALLLEPAGGKDLFDFLVGAGNDVDADQFADPAGGGGARIRGGFDRADIAAHDDADQARRRRIPCRSAPRWRSSPWRRRLRWRPPDLSFQSGQGPPHFSSSTENTTLAQMAVKDALPLPYGRGSVRVRSVTEPRPSGSS